MKALSILFLAALSLTVCSAPLLSGVEVSCHEGSAINGIDGFDIRVFCNPLAGKILFHKSLVEDYAKKQLEESGILLGSQLKPESAMIWIYITTVEMESNERIEGYATSVNIDVNRAALCLLGDEEFHAISSIVWEDDRLVISGIDESRDLILGMISSALGDLVGDLREADPGKYAKQTAGM